MEEVKTWNISEPPTVPGVYEVLVSIHGVQLPRLGDPKIYAYYDGVDTWGEWDFSGASALRAAPNKRFKPVGWRACDARSPAGG